MSTPVCDTPLSSRRPRRKPSVPGGSRSALREAVGDRACVPGECAQQRVERARLDAGSGGKLAGCDARALLDDPQHGRSIGASRSALATCGAGGAPANTRAVSSEMALLTLGRPTERRERCFKAPVLGDGVASRIQAGAYFRAHLV